MKQQKMEKRTNPLAVGRYVGEQWGGETHSSDRLDVAITICDCFSTDRLAFTIFGSWVGARPHSRSALPAAADTSNAAGDKAAESWTCVASKRVVESSVVNQMLFSELLLEIVQ